MLFSRSPESSLPTPVLTATPVNNVGRKKNFVPLKPFLISLAWTRASPPTVAGPFSCGGGRVVGVGDGHADADVAVVARGGDRLQGLVVHGVGLHREIAARADLGGVGHGGGGTWSSRRRWRRRRLARLTVAARAGDRADAC